MANLTITVDDDTLRRARIRALERNESVNAYLGEMLRRYAYRAGSGQVMERIGAIADTHQAGKAGTGRDWTRDDLYRV